MRLLLISMTVATAFLTGINVAIHRDIQTASKAIESPSFEVIFHDRRSVEAEPEPEPTPFSIVYTNESVNYESLDLFCMAKNIYHEARGEGDVGMYAVAQVTLNRYASTRYPNNICEVVMQPRQFSWANDRSMRWMHPNTTSWNVAKDIAEDVIVNGARVHGLESVLYYHANHISPFWQDLNYYVAEIGNHVFYEQAARR